MRNLTAPRSVSTWRANASPQRRPKRKKNNWNMVISVVDDGGHLVALARLDNTQIASVRISIDKARAANNFRRPTKVFQDRAATDVVVLGLPGAITSEGGLPLVLDGKIIGAIGSSGGTSAQDGQVSKACFGNIRELLRAKTAARTRGAAALLFIQ